jgi:hypothetical protein
VSFEAGYDLSEAQLLVTLSSLAYLDSDPLPGEGLSEQIFRMQRDIDAALAASPYSGWQVVFVGVSEDRGTMCFVASDHTHLAVTVRGTDWSFWLNWIQDFSVLTLVPYEDGPGFLSRGTSVGLKLLLDLGLVEFLSDLDLPVFVTGHSLGACLALPLASSLVQRLGAEANEFKIYTFGGPSPGDQSFADAYDELFRGRSFRLVNPLDIVPLSWANLPSIARLYSPGPQPTPALRSLLARVIRRVRDSYAQPAGLIVPGALFPLDPLLAPTTAFFDQVSLQHAPTTYANLLDMPMHSTADFKISAILGVSQPDEVG